MVTRAGSTESTEGPGAWLITHRRALDAGEAAWLDVLGRFDAEHRWAEDGQLSCAEWLMAAAGMARATAYEKVRVARELRCRPAVAMAMAEGRVSYCAVRAITRATGTLTDVDEALVLLAESAPVSDVETAVRAYQLYRSQELPPEERRPRRGLRVRPLGGGMVRVEAVVTAVEGAELEAALAAAMDLRQSPHGDGSDPTPAQSPRGDRTPDRDASPAASPHGDAAPASDDQADQSSCGDGTLREDEVGVVDGADWAERRVDALLELARAGLGRWAAGPDRYLVHLVVQDGEARLLGGPVLAPEERDRLACDTASVVHLQHHGVPLALGRRRRTWSVGQRRAVMVRDAGRCRWPGCERTHVDLHHLRPWEEGGMTDVSNGVALCPRHHTRIHEGFHTSGRADGELVFHRPDGSRLGSSTIGPVPPVTRLRVSAPPPARADGPPSARARAS